VHTVLYCNVLYCTVLYCASVCCAVLCCAVLCCTVLYCAVLSCTVLHCTVLCCSILYCTVLSCPVLSSIFLNSECTTFLFIAHTIDTHLLFSIYVNTVYRIPYTFQIRLSPNSSVQEYYVADVCLAPSPSGS
jgi:hypothetical protein